MNDNWYDPYKNLPPDISPARADILVWAQSGVVRGKELMAANDRHTCHLCKSLHGKVYGLSEAIVSKGDTLIIDGRTQRYDQDVQAPPLHEGCRCTLLA